VLKGSLRASIRAASATLARLEQAGPRYPALNSHPYHSIRGPGGAQVWESYAENRTDRKQADYGPLNAIARNKVNLDKVITHWPDLLRVAGW
jgi:hypothetical protein